MEVVILKTDGTAVRLDNKFTELKFDCEGFLYSLKNAGATYKFFQNDDFEYKGKDVDLGGYYAETVVHQYIANMYNTPMTPLEIKALKKFPFAGLEAQQGESITVKVVDFSAPYNYYYKENRYTFNIETVDNKVKKYKKPVFDNVKLIGFEIDLPSSSFPPTPNDVNLMEQPTGYFFRKNFGEFVGNWSVTDAGKRTYKKITTLSAYKINFIVEDVIKHIIAESSLQRIYGSGNSGTSAEPDPNGFSPLENLVFTLLWSWGYFYKPTDDPIYIYRTVLNPIMSGQPDFYEYSRYYNGLCQFYFTAYRERDKLKELNDYRKLEYLLSILPLAALRTLPYSFIKEVIGGFASQREISQEEQQFVVRLVLSVKEDDANDFLDFLLEQPIIGAGTNFQMIYDLLTDARLERYTIVNWFVDEQTNRKHYAMAIYQLWQVSKFDWRHNANGTTDFVNFDSYFFQNMNSYVENNVFDFRSVRIDELSDTSFVSTKNQIKTFLKASQINVEAYSISQTSNLNKFTGKIEEESPLTSKTKEYFHLFHPISLIGYKANLDLQIPQSSLIPAFLLYFAEEYDDLVDFDAKLSLGIDIAIDLGLFFLSGGLSVLQDLKYLKHLSKLGKALLNKLPPEEAVTVWRGLDVISEGITFTASTIVNYNQYLITQENDLEKRKHHEKIQSIMIGLLFASAGVAVYSRIKAVGEAQEVLDMMAQYPGTTHGVPDSLVELLTTLAGKKQVFISKMRSKFEEIILQEGDILSNVKIKFNALTTDFQYKFWTDFNYINDVDFWRKLNFDNISFDNWLLLRQKDIYEAAVADFIKRPTLVHTINTLYDSPNLRKTLEKFSYEDRLELLKLIIKHEIIQTPIGLTNLINKPSCIDLLKNIHFGFKKGTVDALEISDFIKIVKTDFKDIVVDLLNIKSTTILADVVRQYGKEVLNIKIGKSRLRSIYDGSAQEFNVIYEAIKNDPVKLDQFLDANKLVSTLRVYQDNTIINTVKKAFVSGSEEKVLEYGNIQSLTEPIYTKYRAFNLKAIDRIPQNRRNDTELKFIFDFLENHWDQGNKFRITLESTYYACESCQGYLVYLKKLAKKHDKTLDIEVIAEETVRGAETLRKYLRIN